MRKRKPNGYWKDIKNIKREIDFIKKLYGKWPPTSFVQRKHSSVANGVTKHHGGWEKIIKKCNLPSFRKSDGWWSNFNNVKKELIAIIKKLKKWTGTGHIVKHYPALSWAIVKKHGGFIKVRKQLGLLNIDKHQYKINHQAFKYVNKESQFYWIGFLMADGCIVEEKPISKIISLKLQIQDIGHIKKFLKFLSSNSPIHIAVRKPNNGAYIRIYSNEIAADLLKCGITPRKSFTARASNHVRFNKHFWRGMIDGDGCLSIRKQYKYPAISLCGSRDILNQFVHFVDKFLHISHNKIKKCSGCYSTTYTSYKAVEIVKYLYGNCKIALDRKFKIAKRIMALKKYQ